VTAPTVGDGCGCRERIDAGLAQHNTKVEPIFSLSANHVGMPWPIATVQIEKGRGKLKASTILASFCPFCGVSLRLPEVGAK